MEYQKSLEFKDMKKYHLIYYHLYIDSKILLTIQSEREYDSYVNEHCTKAKQV